MGVYSKRMELEPCQVSNIKLIQMNHKLGYKKQSLKLQGRKKKRGGQKLMTFNLSVTAKGKAVRLDFMKM